MNQKAPFYFILAILALISPAGAQTISNFGVGPVADGYWTYDSSTSTLSGTFESGNQLLITPPTLDYSNANQIVINGTTGADEVIPNGDFLVILEGGSRWAAAVVPWAQLSGFGINTYSLTPVTAGGSLTDVHFVDILNQSVYTSNPAFSPQSATFYNASASSAPQSPTAGSGIVLSTFGSSAATFGAFASSLNYNSTTSQLNVTSATSSGAAIAGNVVAASSAYSLATEISLTATAAPNSNQGIFTVELTDTSGDTAYAAFNYASFTGGATVTATVVPDTFFQMNQVSSWSIVNGATNGNFSLTLQSAALITPGQFTTPIDQFSVATSTVNQVNPTVTSTVTIAGYTNAQRNISVSGGSGNVTATAGSGSLLVAGQGGTGIAIDYSNFTLYAPDQKYFKLDFNLTANLNEISVEFQNPNFGFAIGGLYSIADLEGNQSLLIDLSALDNYSPEFMAGVNNILIGFGSTESEYEFQLDGIEVVPEPSTWTLLFAGCFALFIRKRRRQTH